MSGGSFNYLCHKEVEDLFFSQSDLEQMRDSLLQEGGQDAARETEELILILRQTRTRIEARLGRLRPVWHAMEWWQSCDYSRDQFEKALAEYRGEA